MARGAFKAGDKFRLQGEDVSYELVGEEIAGRWPAIVSRDDDKTWGVIDPSVSMFIRDVERPEIPVIPERYVYITADGRTTFAIPDNPVAMCDIREATWRYESDGEPADVEREFWDDGVTAD